ncbi:glycerol-3-phosphate acyltransferase [Calothrix rhizosoleniae]|uniref:glycerol-3-phosphate acyltransferase n=1 Tax=Calothrix rhizosoleniae TaxID=888997 RepID=UPI000B4A5210|nr:glycerol-3-phosphate acyltransferase [Calothrix rhizosoleniae]
MIELWGALIILTVCPILGSLPLIAWIVQAFTGRQLAQVGTGNISVSAAFYHGGTLTGILAVLSEAFKGVAAVFIARAFFPQGTSWELIALITLVVGRYAVGRGAGTTNVVWGFTVHDPLVAAFVFLLASISFTIVRDRQMAKYGVLLLFPIIEALLHIEDVPRIMAAVVLAGLLAWIYRQIPDDLELPVEEAQPESQAALQFFRGDRKILSLDDELNQGMVGHKAARLSEIRRWGYPVPKGWVLPPYDDPEVLIEILHPSELSPLVVRSTAIGEDSEQASGAGQYETILNVTTKEGLKSAIARVQESYQNPNAVQYRNSLGLQETAMAVLIQQQIRGVFSGVAFSRDPMTQQGDAVVIEALPGNPNELVAGKITPEQYCAFVVDTENFSFVQLEGEGRVPAVLIKQVAYLARHLEDRYHGVPQDIEWSYDGQTLWVLQARPITTLLPIWTRKIAAEVIPGIIHPLTWSINRPLTCGVWGGIFTIALGSRAFGLDFNETATLHYSRAYFNASLLGTIFRRMGLPPESLEFLTRGAKLSKPPLSSTLQNLSGLFRLLGRELTLVRDFQRDDKKYFAPGLSQLAQESVDILDIQEILARIDSILELLRRATYYSIFAPLSASLRQALLRVKDNKIDNSLTPEVSALQSLDRLAASAKEIFPEFDPETLFEDLALSVKGKEILTEFEQWLQKYGYLSEVGTDIAVSTWKEEPHLVKQLFIQLMQGNPASQNQTTPSKKTGGFVQRRVDLKGKVTETYSRFLAELRWSFIALEQLWLESGILLESGDIFFLEFEEIRFLIERADVDFIYELQNKIQIRRSQREKDRQIQAVPLLVYGNSPPPPLTPSSFYSGQTLQGIPASHGQVEGRVKVLRNFDSLPEVNKEIILVVPYTDSGWTLLLAQAGGLIAEAGGRLSHGAIVAREYGIPAVMNVHNATLLLQDEQWVRVDGSRGIVEVSDDLRPR